MTVLSWHSYILCNSNDNKFSSLTPILLAPWYSSVQFILYLSNHVFWCRGCFDICEDDEIANSPIGVDQENGRNEGESSCQGSILHRHAIPEHKKFLSGSLLQENSLSPKKVIGDGDR